MDSQKNEEGFGDAGFGKDDPFDGGFGKSNEDSDKKTGF